MRTVRRLFDVAKSILKTHVALINDFGDTRYELIRDLLLLMKAEQLLRVEEQSPHLMEDDGEIWKHLCITDFVQVRALVEDRKMDEPDSWRELHAEEVVKREARLKGILTKMRGTYQQHADSRGTIKEVDGVAAAKRRKVVISSGARPKSLYDKARSQSRQISSIYAPRRKPPPSPLPSTSRTTTSPDPPRRKPPKVVTIIRTILVPNPRPPLPPSTAIPRPVAPLPARASTAAILSPPPPPPPPSSSALSPRTRPPRPPSLFLPRTKAR